MRGRPCKPKALHVLAGTRASNKVGGWSAEGQPTQLVRLVGHAARLWDHIVPALVRVGVASSIDSAALLGLCQHWGQWVECQEALAEMEPNDKSYYRLQVMASVAWKQFEKTALHFGLTPAARERLHAAGGEIEDVDPFDLLMSRG